MYFYLQPPSQIYMNLTGHYVLSFITLMYMSYLFPFYYPNSYYFSSGQLFSISWKKQTNKQNTCYRVSRFYSLYNNILWVWLNQSLHGNMTSGLEITFSFIRPCYFLLPNSTQCHITGRYAGKGSVSEVLLQPFQPNAQTFE